MQDLHMHTIYCDGKSTPREMVESAILKGLDTVGICCHSYAHFQDESIKFEEIKEFIDKVHSLRDDYKSKIEVLCGVEQDYYAEYPLDEFDYAIGSVHYLPVNDGFVSVDYSPDRFKSDVEKYFDGDFYAYTDLYFDTVSKIFDKWSIDIIGHFDLITKFNEKNHFFDEKNPRYVKAWKSACDKLLTYNKPFEINTGAISRGYRTMPYPSTDIINYIKANSGKLIINSDAHHADNIAYKFKEFEALL